MPDWTGRTVANRDDVARAIAELTRHDRSGTSALARAVQTGDQAELTADASKLLPVVPELKEVMPWPGGLLKGVAVAALGSASLVPTLLAGGMAEAPGWPWWASRDSGRSPPTRTTASPSSGWRWCLIPDRTGRPSSAP